MPVYEIILDDNRVFEVETDSPIADDRELQSLLDDMLASQPAPPQTPEAAPPAPQAFPESASIPQERGMLDRFTELFTGPKPPAETSLSRSVAPAPYPDVAPPARERTPLPTPEASVELPTVAPQVRPEVPLPDADDLAYEQRRQARQQRRVEQRQQQQAIFPRTEIRFPGDTAPELPPRKVEQPKPAEPSPELTPEQRLQEPLVTKAAKSFAAGVGSLESTTGTILKYLGAEETGQRLKEAGEERTARYQVPRTKEFSWRSLLDPEFYAVNMTETLPISLSLLPVAIAGAYLGSATGAAVGLGAFGRLVLGSLMGAAASRPIESAFEAAQQYDAAKQQGATEEEAGRQAEQVFKENLALAGIDAAQIGLAMTPLRGTGAVRRAISAAAKVVGEPVMGSVEEGAQDVIQRRAAGEPIRFDPRMQESMALGFLLDVGIGTGAALYHQLIDRVNTAMPAEQRAALEARVQERVNAGMPESEAVQESLDEFASTEQGQEVIRRTVQDLKAEAQQAETAQGEETAVAPPETQERFEGTPTIGIEARQRPQLPVAEPPTPQLPEAPGRGVRPALPPGEPQEPEAQRPEVIALPTAPEAPPAEPAPEAAAEPLMSIYADPQYAQSEEYKTKVTPVVNEIAKKYPRLASLVREIQIGVVSFGPNVAGMYFPSSKVIALNPEFLFKADHVEIKELIEHELIHAFQHSRGRLGKLSTDELEVQSYRRNTKGVPKSIEDQIKNAEASISEAPQSEAAAETPTPATPPQEPVAVSPEQPTDPVDALLANPEIEDVFSGKTEYRKPAALAQLRTRIRKILRQEKGTAPSGAEAQRLAEQVYARRTEQGAQPEPEAAQPTEGSKTIAEQLGKRRSMRIGTVTILETGEQLKFSIRPDNSEMGAYSAVLTNDQGQSQSIRMQFRAGDSLSHVRERLQDYFDVDTKGQYRVELSPTEARQKPPARKPEPEGRAVDQQDRQKLRELEGRRSKTRPQELQIARLKRRIAADPAKWNEGMGVGWRVTSDQINRGFRIISVDPETKTATIRQVADTGITTTGGDTDRIEDQQVHIADLVRDKKYDKPPEVQHKGFTIRQVGEVYQVLDAEGKHVLRANSLEGAKNRIDNRFPSGARAAEPAQPAVDRKTIAALRRTAEGMQKQIDNKLNPAISDQRPTARRSRIAQGMRAEGERLQRIQTALRALADAHEQESVPDSLKGITSRAALEELLRNTNYPRPRIFRLTAQDLLKNVKGKSGTARDARLLEDADGVISTSQLEALERLLKKATDKRIIANAKDDIAPYKRLASAGIDTQEKFDQAKQDLASLTEGRQAEPQATDTEREIRQKTNALIGRKIPGFFPTPTTIANQMVDAAEIEPGMEVLEPSAGIGNIADVVRERHPDAGLSVIEINTDLRDILQLKGFNLVGDDFLEFTPEKFVYKGSYDRIIMNPPFEGTLPVEHVRHAFDLLKPGGRLVTLLPSGQVFSSDRKVFADFRDFMAEHSDNPEGEQLPQGTFGKEIRSTGVSARMVVLDKEAETPAAAEPEPTVTTEEEFIANDFRDTARILDEQGRTELATRHREIADAYLNPATREDVRRSNLDRIAKLKEQWREMQAAEPEPAAKQPWEMTKQEWFGSEIRNRPEYQNQFGYEQFIQDAIKAGKDVPLEIRKAATPGSVEPWERTRQEYANWLRATRTFPGQKAETVRAQDEQARRIHKQTVEKAIREGKSVPPEVLADYPDLAQQPAESVYKSKGRGPRPGQEVAPPVEEVPETPEGQGDLFEERESPQGRGFPRYAELETYASRGTQAPEVKALFRQAARLFHPNLGNQSDPADVARRTAFMQAAVDAFQANNGSWIQSLIERFNLGWATPAEETVAEPTPQPAEAPAGPPEPPPPPPYTSGAPPKSPLEMPEIVELGKALFEGTALSIGIQKTLRRDSGVRGYFTPGRGIRLRGDIFADPEAAAQTLAHEIGHAVDWIEGEPSRTLKRGNILGSIASLHRFMRREFQGILNKDIRNELIKFTAAWKPFDPAADPKYTKYRHNARELYADFISGLLNAPAWTQQVAPRTFDAFFQFLDKKPRVKALYDGIQGRINSGGVSQRRRERVQAMFARGETARRERAEARAERSRWQGITDWVMSTFIDQDHPIISKSRTQEQRGEISEDNPRIWMERLRYGRSEERAWLSGIERVHSSLEQAGISPDDFGAILFHERVINERGEYANPEGFTPRSSRQQLDQIKQDMGDEKWSTAQAIAGQFREAWQGIRARMREANILSSETMDKLEANDFYATFNVLHHFESQEGAQGEFGMSSGVFSQIGTLNEVENPYVATVMKGVSTLRMIQRKEAAHSVADFLNRHFPDEIEPAKRGENGRFLKPRNREKALLAYPHEGKMQGWYVSKDIADSFDAKTTQYQQAGRYISPFAHPFRALFTRYSPGFLVFNAIKDPRSTAANLPTVGRNRATRIAKGIVMPITLTPYFVKAVGPSLRRGFRKPDAIIREMEQQKILVSITETIGLTEDDTTVERLLHSYALRPEVWTNKIVKPFSKIFDFIEAMTTASEVMSKVAAYEYLKKRQARAGWSDATVEHMTRALPGTPPFLRSGDAAPIYNNFALFSNVWKEGQRRDWEAVSRDPVDYAMRRITWSITPKLIMIAMAVGLLGDEIKAIMDAASEYDKTNYQIIPIAMRPDGKGIYLRVPDDELGRFMGGVVWKSYKAISGEPGGSVTTLFDYMAGQAPTINPLLEAAINAVAISLGVNPMDWFYNRPVVPEQEFEAGGWRKWAAYINHTWNSLGGTVFWRDLPRDILPKTLSGKKAELRKAERKETQDWLERTLNMPSGFLAPIQRFLKITDQGHSDRLRAIAQEVRQEKARGGQEINERIVDFIHNNRETLPYAIPDSILRGLYMEMGSEGLPVGDFSDFKRRAKQLSFIRVDSPWFQAYIHAESKEERFSIMGDYAKSLEK